MTTDRGRRLDRLAGCRGAPAGAVVWTTVRYLSGDATPGEVRRAFAYVKVKGAGLAVDPDIGKWERRPGEREAAFIARVEAEINRVAAGRQVFVTAYT